MSDFEGQLLRANELISLRRDAQAMELLLRLLREQPQEAGRIEFLLSRAHLTANRPREAEAHARRAVTALPQEPGSHLLLGAALQLQSRRAEAVAPLVTAIRLDPDQASAHRLLAQVYSDLGRHREAYAAAGEGLRLAPDDAESHFAMGYALQDTNPWEAARAYRATLALDPEHTTAKHNLAGISATTGDWDTASRGMARVLAESPGAQSPIFVLDQRVVGVIRWLHWVTLGGYFLYGMSASFGAWPGFGAAVVIVVAGSLLALRGIRPIREALPEGGGRYFAGFAKRERIATAWLALLLLGWLLMLGGSLADVLVGNELRWVGGPTLLLLIIGMILSWVRVPLASRRAERVRREGTG